MEDYIYWRLSLEFDDVVGKPRRFMKALESVFGEAGAAVYEYKLVDEVQREFNLPRGPGMEELTGKRKLGELFGAAVTAAWMAS